MSELDDASEAASLAVKFDQAGQIDKAVECYKTAARLLDRTTDKVSPDKQPSLFNKIKEYLERANLLLEQKDAAAQQKLRVSAGAQAAQQCGFALQQALEADEAGLHDLALRLYTQAVELAVSVKSSEPEVKEKITNLAKQALDRAEQLKGASSAPAAAPTERSKEKSDGGGYSPEEKRVLALGSRVNDNLYLPFMDSDLAERFQYATPFQDPAGPLKLSAKQAAEFARWVRPHEVFASPSVLAGDKPDCYAIRQTIVSDCSVVASLAVSAQLETRTGRRLVSGAIFPRDRNKRPVYNPFGKYMVRLHLNGVPRKVIIDDLLPWSVHGRLLCAGGARGELWPALLEKAYMKVMGGYDFPGSNSNIDVHALTGWVPERVALRPEEPGFDGAGVFRKLRARLGAGQLLATAATGALPPADADRAGLVSSHAYALLDAQEVDGVQLVKLKNPWAHVAWRGAYSARDSARWTPALRRALRFDPARADDDGVFWIDFASLLRFFDVLYFSWDPHLFNYTFCTHQEWSAGLGPARDAFSLGANPQWTARARGPGALWLLLTRHITDIADFRDNAEYIALLVYKGGERVYYPYDPPPYIDGVRINSPHYLCKIAVGTGAEQAYTLVVSQYEKTRSIQYTLRAYSTCEFSLAPLPPPPHTADARGEWRGGGSGAVEFAVEVREGAELTLQLRAPRELWVALELRPLRLDDAARTAPFREESSGPYRNGYVCLRARALPAGRYGVRARALPPAAGPCLLEAASSRHLTCEAL